MSKKMCKRIFSVILSLGLVMVQSMNVNAAVMKLVNIQYSFSGRYAVWTGIYLGF